MRIGMLIAALAGAFVLASPVAAQQQPQRDPFNGQFGALEIAPLPAEAARLAKLMGDALEAVEPQRPGVQDVYMLSVSFWGDPVFEREATQAEEILRPHLGAQGRSIILSAGGQGARTYPAATPDNFAAAIGHIGSVIDPNEDLVVIFITTHGQSDGVASIREHNRLFAGLRPAHLSTMLSQANIHNRVVIISACFAGAFIAPLATESTIVMTAAAPDRSSFGCQPQNNWTFFGDAYFNRSVREGGDMIEAFDDAKRLIAQWEREQNLSPPSNPQIFVGPRAAAMLRRAERDAR
ncbi:MAG: C13 family peptidase [Caulobacteraceae bacterium]